MSSATTYEATLAGVCATDQHYMIAYVTSTRKWWICVRCNHAKPFGDYFPAPR